MFAKYSINAMLKRHEKSVLPVNSQLFERIFKFLIKPLWPEYHGLPENTFTLENSTGFVFCFANTFLFPMAMLKMYLDETRLWLTSILAHSPRGGSGLKCIQMQTIFKGKVIGTVESALNWKAETISFPKMKKFFDHFLYPKRYL